MIELVVFDLAGTTVHDGDAVNRCLRAALDAAGMGVGHEAVNAVMGLPKPEAIRILLADSGRDVDAIHADFVKRMLHHYATDPAVGEIPGARATFAALRGAGVKVALNTGFDRGITEALLKRLGWTVPDVIDAVVTSDQVARGRPHPDMIRHLMAQLGIDDPPKVAKVGDTWADLEEGANAGCGLVIGVTSGAFTREQLQARPHSHVVGSVAEVPGLLAATR